MKYRFKIHHEVTLEKDYFVTASSKEEAETIFFKKIYGNFSDMEFVDGDYEISMVIEHIPEPKEIRMDFRGFTATERADFERWDSICGCDCITSVIESRDGSRKYKVSSLTSDDIIYNSIEELMDDVRYTLNQWDEDGMFEEV